MECFKFPWALLSLSLISCLMLPACADTYLTRSINVKKNRFVAREWSRHLEYLLLITSKGIFGVIFVDSI